jgi:phosphonatase-like hydrolase
VTFRVAVLDMAGTTIDEGGLVYEVLDATVADRLGAPVPPRVLARWKGTSKREAVAGLLAELGGDAGPAEVDLVFEDFLQRLRAGYASTPPRPITGVPEAFEAMRARGAKIALQTGYSAPIATALLAGLGWRVGDTIDALVTSDLVPASRPAPYLVFRCMEATGVDDVRAVLVAGDTPNDLLAGHRAGAGFVVGVATGSFTLERLAEEPHTHLLASVADIPGLLNQ